MDRRLSTFVAVAVAVAGVVWCFFVRSACSFRLMFISENLLCVVCFRLFVLGKSKKKKNVRRERENVV